ncbi:MAG: deoxyribose-phosphate aldolase [Brevibacterium aurantiacum]|uniref:Deoxyribose-phosphate aldolase n=1 Tax=Brevibacterium aurantiacum TaxID=273384 RepID=A0A2A3ZGB6_BREAU|nr:MULTISPECIES: deoxyribose-phosphate aldolase [Brevibacterium]AZL06542.1 deoxyribose-phosphate aldolase [Brevibacterium aurantiacum]AZL10134.1 deoxyribose-phosphate aldolase [Brevibacterium aurantiacum]AZL13839.1 deoxyribose-phosphate aldolase [Brevibacterium aurantiacum]AZT94344.1 deoxyribose-phosphate aldolase [Brevibacterium aurantiacum]AZT98073.1 deoxyribose-phosphate aldolase [Brevibacterium aurantiacum]
MTSRSDVAAIIDHTLLKPEATPADVEALVSEAKELGVLAICVSPSMLPVTEPGELVVATVVGFPSGQVKPEIKAAEAARAVSDGAAEVDMVINIGQAIAGDFDAVEADIRGVVDASGSALVKVIIESAALSDEQIVDACARAETAGAGFVKTSTGFHPAGGASAHAVALMRETVGDRLGVKASGGIRTVDAAEEMIAAGASRLGLSGSAGILAELS